MSDLEPVLLAAGVVADQVRLTGLRVRGHHGVLEHERRDGQDFLVDAVLHLDSRPAARTDDLQLTVDYGALAVALAEAVRRDPVDLIETLADRLVRLCLAPGGVLAAEVSVHKPAAPIPETFTDVAVTVRRSRAELELDLPPARPLPVVLGLGTNLGDGPATLAAAVAALSATDGVTVEAVSPLYASDPVGGPQQPRYLNAVLLATTALSPRALLARCQQVEQDHGRTRRQRWGPRTLDIDLLDVGGLQARSPDLTLPHPRAADRAFVLAPWADVDPQAVLTGPRGPRRVLELLADLPDRDRHGLERVLGGSAAAPDPDGGTVVS